MESIKNDWLDLMHLLQKISMIVKQTTDHTWNANLSKKIKYEVLSYHFKNKDSRSKNFSVFFFCQTVLLREIRDGNITLEKWKKKKKNRENSSNSKSKMGA